MKPDNMKTRTYIDSSKETKNKDPKFKNGDFLRISKYKDIFGKRYTPEWTEAVFVIKNIVPWTMLLYVIIYY